MDVFKFKEFSIQHQEGVMKTGFDGVLLGAWAEAESPKRILDIGTGTGLLALMLAQRYRNADVLGIDINENAITLAQSNVEGVSWAEKVSIEHLPTGKVSEMKVDGVFIFAGYLPNTETLVNHIALTERNEIIVDSDMKTNVPGVFAAGDSNAKRYRQITTAVADGTIAALSASEFLRG